MQVRAKAHRENTCSLAQCLDSSQIINFVLFISACACHVPGVNSSADSSLCDSNTGQCDCKSHVTGRACDTCHDTYWRLSESNKDGCEGMFAQY